MGTEAVRRGRSSAVRMRIRVRRCIVDVWTVSARAASLYTNQKRERVPGVDFYEGGIRTFTPGYRSPNAPIQAGIFRRVSLSAPAQVPEIRHAGRTGG